MGVLGAVLRPQGLDFDFDFDFRIWPAVDFGAKSVRCCAQRNEGDRQKVLSITKHRPCQIQKIEKTIKFDRMTWKKESILKKASTREPFSKPKTHPANQFPNPFKLWH